jgi:hypothetical protein
MLGSDIKIELENFERDGEPLCSVHLIYVGPHAMSAHMLLKHGEPRMTPQEFWAYAEIVAREKHEHIDQFARKP